VPKSKIFVLFAGQTPDLSPTAEHKTMRNKELDTSGPSAGFYQWTVILSK